MLIQPGRTIIKTTLGANFEAERAKQLRGAMQKLTKQSVAGACGEDCCGRRLAEQVYAVLRGDERGQLISAPVRPEVKIFFFIFFLQLKKNTFLFFH